MYVHSAIFLKKNEEAMKSLHSSHLQAILTAVSMSTLWAFGEPAGHGITAWIFTFLEQNN